MNQNKIISRSIFAVIILSVIITSINFASAGMVLDYIQFDPAIISSGDQVDVVVQYHFDSKGSEIDNSKIANPDYSFKTILESKDSLAKEHITLIDSDGENLKGAILSGQNYIKNFKIKISSAAPSGDYGMTLSGQWYRNDDPIGTLEEIDFIVPVKKQGILISVAQLSTQPTRVKAGMEDIKLIGTVENIGEKYAKSVSVDLILPDGMSPSYSSGERVWIGSLDGKSTKEFSATIDLDDNVSSGEYKIGYNIQYTDENNNEYTNYVETPLYVDSRPYLVIKNSNGVGESGGQGYIEMEIENIGEDSAEAVDVRLIKQSSQPFELEVRSQYLGEIEPGDVAVARFEVGVNREAKEGEYSLKVFIRSKGDSDEGDDEIYIYNRKAEFLVKEGKPSIYIVMGLIVILIVSSLMIVKRNTGDYIPKKIEAKRIVYFVAGSLVLLSASLGLIYSEYWFIITFFVGLNLFQSSFTNFCPLEKILRKYGVKR